MRGKLTLMVMEPPAIDCKELKTRHGRVASEKSVQRNAHALTRPRAAAGGFADAGLQVVRTCMLVRASLSLSTHVMLPHETQHLWDLGRTTGLDESSGSPHGTTRCVARAQVATIGHRSLGSKCRGR